MLIAPTHIALKTPIDLPRDATQILIDGEAFFVGLGLLLYLRCIPCQMAGDIDGSYCNGGANASNDEFVIECACSRRTGRGLFSAPVAPSAPVERELLADGVKRVERLTRAQVTDIQAYESVLKSMRMQCSFRCLRCQLADRPDGITGAKERAMFLMECSCTKRVGDVVTIG